MSGHSKYCRVWQLFFGVFQVGDEIVEINGEPARGISHTRAIELIQAGGNKVVLLLRPGAGLAQDASEWFSNISCLPFGLTYVSLILWCSLMSV